MDGSDAVPAGFRLRPDDGARLIAGGTVLTGGSPVKVLRLAPAGARAVAAWFAGEPVADSPSARRLARRLTDAGIAHPVPPRAGPSPEDVTVVIPVKDRQAELARCLRGLAGLRVIVVDDGSADLAATTAVVSDAGARLIRREVCGGPAAARNTGLAAVTTPFAAFLDSDCVPGSRAWLDTLLPHFTDPAIGAVAPRIVPHEQGTGWLARYEGASSTLDMGHRPSIVRPGARVSYVPGAALLVKVSAAGQGFDEKLRVGEDVDFVWRLVRAGWRVRYEPVAEMGHEHRVRLRPWLTRRREYGTSAAALEQRHPGAVRPLYISDWTAAAWVAALSGRRVVAVGITAGATVLLARRLAPLLRTAPEAPGVSGAAGLLAARLAAGGTVAAVRPAGSAITRTWLPLALPAAVAFRRLRVPLATVVLTPPLLDWLDRRPPLDPARYVLARLLDDASYGAGVWQGCLRRRTIRPLLPARRPPRITG